MHFSQPITRYLGRLLGTQHPPNEIGVTRDMIVALLRYRPNPRSSSATSSSPAPLPWVAFRRRRIVHFLPLGFRLIFPQGPLQFRTAESLLRLVLHTYGAKPTRRAKATGCASASLLTPPSATSKAQPSARPLHGPRGHHLKQYHQEYLAITVIVNRARPIRPAPNRRSK